MKKLTRILFKEPWVNNNKFNRKYKALKTWIPSFFVICMCHIQDEIRIRTSYKKVSWNLRVCSCLSSCTGLDDTYLVNIFFIFYYMTRHFKLWSFEIFCLTVGLSVCYGYQNERLQRSILNSRNLFLSIFLRIFCNFSLMGV